MTHLVGQAQRRSLDPSLFLENALVKAPQKGSQRQEPLDRVESQTAARLQLEICTQSFALGKLLQSAEDEYALLLAENKTLKADILERSHALECEWLGFTESICARVDALYHRLNKFHQELRTEYLEFTYKHSTYYDSNNYYGLGESLGIQEAYFTYAEGDYGIATYLRKLQHLRSSLQGTLKTTLKEEIQKINKNALRNFPSAEASNQQEVSIHVDDLVKSFMQNCQDKIQCQQNSNLEIRKHNTFLTAQKEALANMDAALLKIFHEKLSPCFTLTDCISFVTGRNKHNLEKCLIRPKEFLQNPHSIWAKAYDSGGQHSKELEVSAKVNAHLRETKPMLNALLNKDSP